MKRRIRDRRALALGLTFGLAATVCLGLLGLTRQPRFGAGGGLLAALAAFYLGAAFRRKGLLEELAEHTDERDRYVADRSGRAAMGLLNALLAGGCFCALLLYAAFRLPAILAVAITLCAVLALQLLLLAAANRYYEKRL